MAAMTITDYLINAVFVLIVFRQARERELDRRSVIIPLAIIAYVAHLYVRSIPTAGNDFVLIARARGRRPHAGCRQRLCYPRPSWREWSRRRARGLDRRRAADRRDRLADGVRVRALPRRAPRGRQLQHRPPDRRRRLAGGAGVDGAARGQHPDRDRPAPWPPRDAVQRRDRPPRHDAATLPTSRSPARSGGPDRVLSSAPR